MIGNLLKRLKYLVFITNSSTFVKSVERLNKLMLSKMKQYTTHEQTAKLIELEFEKPKGWSVEGISSWFVMYKHKDNDEDFNYSIGELIEILKPIKNLKISVYNSYNDLEDLIVKRLVNNEWEILFGAVGEDLIDLLFSAIVKLKEDEVI